jgi:hypothetical protein
VPRATRKNSVKRTSITLPKPRRGRRLSPGLVRLDYPKVKGYLVRIGYRRTVKGWRPRFKAYFGDGRYGGPRRAKAAAEAWLKQLIKTGRPPKIAAQNGARRG